MGGTQSTDIERRSDSDLPYDRSLKVKPFLKLRWKFIIADPQPRQNLNIVLRKSFLFDQKWIFIYSLLE